MGRPVAYRISKRCGVTSFDALRLTTNRAFLLFKPTRTSSAFEGWSHLALVLRRIHDIDEYMDART